MLRLWCTVAILFTCAYAESSISDTLVNDDTREKAQDISAEVRKHIRSFRGGSRELYERLLKSILVVLCDQKIKRDDASEQNPQQRFVSAENPHALTYANGTCVQVTQAEDEVKQAYEQGKCEVKATCYWAPMNISDPPAFRYPVYALEEAKGGSLREGDVTLARAKQILTEWASGLAKLLAPGIILAVLTFLTMLLFLFCRCCCNKCGGRNPNPNGYSLFKKLVPTFFLLVFAAAIAAMLALSHLYNAEIMTSISKVFEITNGTLGDASQWITQAREPLIDVRDDVFETVDKVQLELESTDFIETGLDGITTRVEAFGQTTANVSLPRGCASAADPQPFCYPCEVCESIDRQVSKSNEEMEDLAKDGIAEIANVRRAINGELVTIKGDIYRMVSDKVNQTNTLLDTIDEAQERVMEINEEYDTRQEIKEVGFSAVFVLFILVMAITIIGLVFGLFTPCKFIVNVLHLAYLLGFLTLLFGFLTSSVMLALSILLGDVCELSLIMQDDWSPYLGESQAIGINACFRNESLLVAYDLESTLDFQEMIEFPESEVPMNFSTFSAFKADIENTDDSTFDMDPTLLEYYIDGLNGFTGLDITAPDFVCRPQDNRYTLANIWSPWLANGEAEPMPDENSDKSPGYRYMAERYSNVGPRATELVNCDSQVTPEMCTRDQDPCGYRDVVLELYTNITTLVQIQTDAKAFVTDMKSNMTSLDTYITTFSQNVSNFEANLDGIKTELEDSLYTHVNEFKSRMYCPWVSTRFNDMLDEMCGNLLPNFLMISLCLLLASVFLIPITICNIILCKRLKAPGDGSVMPDDTEFK